MTTHLDHDVVVAGGGPVGLALAAELAARAASIDAGSVTSRASRPASPSTSSSARGSRAVPTTSCPRATASTAVTRPIPRDVPVTRTRATTASSNHVCRST